MAERYLALKLNDGTYLYGDFFLALDPNGFGQYKGVVNSTGNNKTSQDEVANMKFKFSMFHIPVTSVMYAIFNPKEAPAHQEEFIHGS